MKNLVVDPSSVEVNRKAEPAKTDKMDVGKVVKMLMTYENGERKVVWSVVKLKRNKKFGDQITAHYPRNHE